MGLVVPKNKKKFKILLLTHRDSDNLGDQILEICDCSLIGTVMKNLGVQREGYVLESRSCAILPQNYFKDNDPALLERPETLVKKADLLIFGGSPILNYKYGRFANNTAEFLRIAKECQTPVLFSSAGVNGYNAANPVCQRLVQSLHDADVRQITTRDDLDSLKKMVFGKDIPIERVADPAVFSSAVFRSFITKKEENKKKKIGIFIMRADGFTDNGIPFTKEDMVALWKDLAEVLTDKGYDYEFLTSGFVEDEAMLDDLVRNYMLDKKKCTFNMNTPERLIEKISSFDAVISTRMHPSIVSYSLGVPSVSLLWNPKVKLFYESAGYPDRCLDVTGMTAQKLVGKLESVLTEGVKQDPEYLYSVYLTLFGGIKEVLFPENENLPYSLEETLKNMEEYPGTSEEEKEQKIQKKFRRIYRKFNERSGKTVSPEPKEEKMTGKVLSYLKKRMP